MGELGVDVAVAEATGDASVRASEGRNAVQDAETVAAAAGDVADERAHRGVRPRRAVHTDLRSQVVDVIADEIIARKDREAAAEGHSIVDAADEVLEKEVGVRVVALAGVEHPAGRREEKPCAVRVGEPVSVLVQVSCLDQLELADVARWNGENAAVGLEPDRDAVAKKKLANERRTVAKAEDVRHDVGPSGVALRAGSCCEKKDEDRNREPAPIHRLLPRWWSSLMRSLLEAVHQGDELALAPRPAKKRHPGGERVVARVPHRNRDRRKAGGR